MSDGPKLLWSVVVNKPQTPQKVVLLWDKPETVSLDPCARGICHVSVLTKDPSVRPLNRRSPLLFTPNARRDMLDELAYDLPSCDKITTRGGAGVVYYYKPRAHCGSGGEVE